MEKEKKFDSNKYKQEWAKKNKKQFRVDLNIDEYEELCILLNEKKISKAQFLRDSIKELKKK